MKKTRKRLIIRSKKVSTRQVNGSYSSKLRLLEYVHKCQRKNFFEEKLEIDQKEVNIKTEIYKNLT